MANTQIDIAKTAQLKDISDSATGTVTNDVRVIIAVDTTTLEAVVALQNVIAALVSDQITIQTS